MSKKRNIFRTLICLLGIFFFFPSCGDDQWDQVGEPCSGSVDGELVCMPAFSAQPTWEKPCQHPADCPEGAACIFPPEAPDDVGVCDVHNHYYPPYYGSCGYYYCDSPYYYGDPYYYDYYYYYYDPYYYYYDPYYYYYDPYYYYYDYYYYY